MIIVQGPLPPADPRLDPNKNPGRLAFDAWGSDNRYWAAPDPCLVCGMEKNLCTAETHAQAQSAQSETQPAMEASMRSTRVQGTAAANADPNSGLYVVPDDIVEEYVPAGGAKRTSRRLVHYRGEVITKARAAELGLIASSAVPPSTVTAPLYTANIEEGPAFTPVQD